MPNNPTLASISSEDALSEWRLWPLSLLEAPKILRLLEGGLTNQSYLIESKGKRFKLRLNARNSTELGINREQESTILNAVAHLGVSPKLLYSSNDFRYSIFEFIEGRIWSKDDLTNPNKAALLFDLLDSYQKIPINLPGRNYLAYLKAYQDQLQPNNLTREEWSNYLALLRDLETTNGRWLNAKLCHHDLVPENIIETGNGLCILDWEYAAMGCGEIDKLSIDPDRSVSSPLAKALHFWLNKLWYVIQKQA